MKYHIVLYKSLKSLLKLFNVIILILLLLFIIIEVYSYYHYIYVFKPKINQTIETFIKNVNESNYSKKNFQVRINLKKLKKNFSKNYKIKIIYFVANYGMVKTQVKFENGKKYEFIIEHNVEYPFLSFFYCYGNFKIKEIKEIEIKEIKVYPIFKTKK